MINYEKDVREFHSKYGPFTIAQQRAQVEEEALELIAAIAKRDRVAIAGECVDLLYAALGLAAGDAEDPGNIIDCIKLLGDEVAIDLAEWSQIDCVMHISTRCRTGNIPYRMTFAAKAIAKVYSAPLPPVWAEVHAANMRKVRNPAYSRTPEELEADRNKWARKFSPEEIATASTPVRKPTKPPGWVGPDIAGVLGLKQGKLQELYVIFDGPPTHEAGRFVEVENTEGKSVSTNCEWVEQSNGYWALGPFYDCTSPEPNIIQGKPCDNLAAPKKVCSYGSDKCGMCDEPFADCICDETPDPEPRP